MSDEVFDVVSRSGVVICSGLDRHAADMKVENEQRFGYSFFVVPHVPPAPFDATIYDEEDD